MCSLRMKNGKLREEICVKKRIDIERETLIAFYRSALISE